MTMGPARRRRAMIGGARSVIFSYASVGVNGAVIKPARTIPLTRPRRHSRSMRRPTVRGSGHARVLLTRVRLVRVATHTRPWRLLWTGGSGKLWQQVLLEF